MLKARYPGQKFSIYAKNLDASNVTFSQSLILEKNNLGDNSGRLLGICLYNSCNAEGAKEITKGKFQGQEFIVADLEKIRKENLSKKNGWYAFSAVTVYDDVQNWWKK